jgi:hypothetical protein
MKKSGWLFIVIITLLLFLLLCFLGFNNLKNMTFNSDEILLNEYSAWGPCPNNFTCWANLTLYYTGKLVLDGKVKNTTYLKSSKINQITSLISSTNIMNKNCSAELVVDYYSTFTINYKDVVKVITFPGCQDEIMQIKELFA